MVGGSAKRAGAGWAVVLLAVLAAVLSACNEGESGSHQGYVEAEYTYLASPQGGYLHELAVQRGQALKSGQLVFTLRNQALDDAAAEAAQRKQQAADRLADMQKGARPSELRAIEAQLDQAMSSLKLTKLEYERRLKLRKQKAIPEADLDKARTMYDRDRAQAAQLQAQLTTAKLGAREDQIKAARAEAAAVEAAFERARWTQAQLIRTAPVDGLVQDTYFTKGEWVPAGRPVASMLAPGNLKVRFFVPEPRLSSVKLGQTVLLACDGCAPGLKGQVSYISPDAEYTPPVIYSAETRAKLVFMVEARPSGPALALKPGQPMEVRLASEGK